MKLLTVEEAKKVCDFSGWVTKNDLKCADGRVIRHNAFAIQNGHTVPLVWNHRHDKVGSVLGKVVLENRDEGVYGYGLFNNTTAGKDAKESVLHGDVTALSIHANNLRQIGSDVLHGVIREVSLVLAGANPGAFIESAIQHGEPMEDGDEECVIHTGEDLIIEHGEVENMGEELKHAEEETDEKKEKNKSGEGKTVAEVVNTMNEEQKKAMAILIGQAIADSENKSKGNKEEEAMHNAFESDAAYQVGGSLTHAEIKAMEADFLQAAKKIGSLREARRLWMQENDGVDIFHALDTTGMVTATGSSTYGFNDPEMLFPEYKTLNGEKPEFISRNQEWVSKFFSKVHRTPFSRIKSVYANITEDEARAKGYIKGNMKKEEVFTLLKRTTDPQTVYKKQKLDRDDVLDITGLDIVAWIRAEMRVMLNEEIARACLIGDGRPADSEDKIQELHVRPIVKDVALYNTVIKVSVAADATEGDIAQATIKAVLRGRKNFKGSGRPTFWTTDDVITEMLMLENKIGDSIYKTEGDLATKLRVDELVPVEVMDNQSVEIAGTRYPLIGVIVNPTDYNIGADKGGDITNFEDFDIDYNQHKYLIETRISGALIKPFAALTIVLDKAATGRSAAPARSAD